MLDGPPLLSIRECQCSHGRQWIHPPVLFSKKNYLLGFCSIEADTWIFLCLYALHDPAHDVQHLDTIAAALRRSRRGSSTRPWLRPIYKGMIAAQEANVFKKWYDASDDFPIFGTSV